MKSKFLLWLVKILYKYVRINKQTVINYLDIIDADKDGFITVSEIAASISNLLKRV